MNLYIVSTPIGNLQDITLRAAKVLLDAKIIIAESTSKAGILLAFLEETFQRKRISDQKIISMTEDEEIQNLHQIIKLLEENDAVLISEAGTPLISDPGFKLVREALRRGAGIVPVPGPTAAMGALSVSGLPTDKFLFLGFLPKSASKKAVLLGQIKKSEIKSTTIIYESPERLIKTLELIKTIFGDIHIVIARELTKIHEEIIRGKVGNALVRFEQKPPKGEFVILFSIFA